MEFVKGRTLKDVLQEQGPYSSQEAQVVGLELCQALAAVHHAGFPHCDIKARMRCASLAGAFAHGFWCGRRHERQPAISHQILGTPLYMAPEVLMGDAPTVQSDLSSLGILLYHLVSGEFP